MALTQVKTTGIADDAVTGAKIADDTVAEANMANDAISLTELKAGTDGQIITWDASGNPVAVGPGTDGQVLTSTGSGSPPAFENNPAAVGGGTGLDFNDDVKARFGTGNDLELQHTSGHSRITHGGAGNLIVEVTTTDSDLVLRAEDKVSLQPHNGNDGVVCNAQGSVDLYYNNAKKFETSADGVTMSGWIYIPDSDGSNNMMRFGNGADLQIYHNGSDSYIDEVGTGSVLIRSDTHVRINKQSAAESMATFTPDGSVELFYDNVKKFETSSGGVVVSGSLEVNGGDVDFSDHLHLSTDNKALKLGADTDMQVYHNGSHGYIKNTTGTLHAQTDLWKVISAAAGEVMIQATSNGATELYHDGSNKFETESGGAKVNGNLTVRSGTSSQINFYDDSTHTITNYTSSVHLRWWDQPGSDVIMSLENDGDLRIDGSYATGGLDYAEYFESTDGSAIPVGTTVILDNGKVRAATGSETPIGVIRPKTSGTSVTGGQNEFKWQGKYLTDDYDGILVENATFCTWEQDGESKQCWKDRPPTGETIPTGAVEKTLERRKLNPSFDKSKTYVPRSERAEWNCVGLLGQIPITKGQPTASNWIKMKERSSTVELWFVK